MGSLATGVLWFVVVMLLLGRETAIQRMDSKLRMMHHLLLRMASRLELEPDPLNLELMEIIGSQGRIAAIKHVRAALGLDLRAAKEYVDLLAKRFEK